MGGRYREAIEVCGIAGFIDLRHARTADANARLIQAMEAAMRHRGPDAGAVWSDLERGVWLAHRRLSIVDLSEAGAQPMASADGRLILTYNGEGYNAASLRPELQAAGYRFRGYSDTEVVLNGILHWGVDGLCDRLNGMFAFACWEPQRRRLTLARDRLGKKPLYWAKTARAFLFASELSPLILHPDCPRGIDDASVAGFLRTGYVPEPASIFDGVEKVPAGGIVSFDLADDAVDRRRYWTVADAARRGVAEPFSGSPEEAVDLVGTLLQDAVTRRMVSDVPLGSLLSGGVDSSLVTAMMQAGSSRAVKTFSIGYDDPNYDESAYAEAVSAHLGTEHHGLIVTPAETMDCIAELPFIYDEPFADVSQIPTYMVSRMARREVTVVLTGDGGDEVFAGYNRHVAAGGLLGRLSRLPVGARQLISGGMTALSPDRWQSILNVIPESCRPRNIGEKLHKLAPLLSLNERERYRSLISQWSDVEAVQVGAERLGPIDDLETAAALPDPVARMRWLDLVTYLPGDVLTKVDRATMAVGLEARAPLVDHRLVELSWRFSSATHLNQGKGKWILRRLLERHVPLSLFERPKSGFGIPIGAWLRGPLREWAESLLSAEALNDTGFVSTAAVREVWRRHLKGEINAQYGLWTILMLQAWHEAHKLNVSAKVAA